MIKSMLPKKQTFFHLRRCCSPLYVPVMESHGGATVCYNPDTGYLGISVCSNSDQFSRRVGRSRACVEALHGCHKTQEAVEILRRRSCGDPRRVRDFTAEKVTADSYEELVKQVQIFAETVCGRVWCSRNEDVHPHIRLVLGGVLNRP